MFDQDIFESECSNTKAVLQERKMSSQHQSIFDCLLSSPRSFPQGKPKKYVEAQPDVCFTQIQFFSQNFSTFNSQVNSNEQLVAESQQEQKVASSKQSERACNNIASYIIKHCFRQVLSLEFKEEVQTICQQESITYSEFIVSWKQQINHIQKHFGVNSLLKMMKKNQSPQIQVVRYFTIIYLRYQYPLYVLGSNKGRKELYIQNSVKILYLIDACKDKCQRLIKQAQNGPKNR